MTDIARQAASQSFLRMGQAHWIWGDKKNINPKNRFTWFCKKLCLDRIPPDCRLIFAADSNAWLWINGHVMRRKVTRYHEPAITCELIDAGPWLRVGENVVLVRHHNWGEITTFQRTGNIHAGLYVEADWVKSDASWQWQTAQEYLAHEEQIIGLCDEARRIRYPVVLDGRLGGIAFQVEDNISDVNWQPAYEIHAGPWPSMPEIVETPGQRETFQAPLSLLAAGVAIAKAGTGIYDIAKAISTAQCHPVVEMERAGAKLLEQRIPFKLTGRHGQRLYLTFDFYRPVHGFPTLQFTASIPGITLDIGYAEVPITQYEGRRLVEENGWLDTQAIAGQGYADRVISNTGQHYIELPDERTARWLTVHIQFPAAGELELRNIGFIKSQYPIQRLGSFTCGDERIEQIVKLCLIHAEVTMSDVYVDTPGREDGQWIEDDRPRALLAARWFGDHSLRRVLLRTFAEGQGDRGNFHPFFPSNYPAFPSALDWSIQWTSALWDDWMWTGRTDYVERFFPVLKRFWHGVLQNVSADGLWLEHRVNADIRNSLIPLEGGSSGMISAWIIGCLRRSEQLADSLGQKAIAQDWHEISARMTEAFRKHHLVADYSEFPLHVADRYQANHPDLPRGISQAGQLMAILNGLLTPEECRQVIDFAFPAPDGTPPVGVTRWNNPTWGNRALRAMSDNGYAARAVTHLIERYAPYLPGNARNSVPLRLQGPYGGPLPEYWVSREDMKLDPGTINYQQPVDETGSHGWGAVPLLWFHEALLGVQIIEPGGARLRIAPQAGGLPYISGTTCTPRGLVTVHYEPQTLTLEIHLPARVEANVVLPREFEWTRVACGSADLAAEWDWPMEGELVIRSAGVHRFQCVRSVTAAGEGAPFAPSGYSTSMAD